MRTLYDYIVYALSLLSVSSKEPKKEDEVVKDAYEWFLKKSVDKTNTEVQESNEPWLLPGKIYVFKYEPVPDKYEYWDKHPIVLNLGKMQYKNGKTYNLGINISWYPPSAREYIINEIRNMYKRDIEKAMKSKPAKALEQKSYQLDLYILKLKMDKIGLSFAIRNYDPSRIKSPKYCISYEHWDKAIRMDQPKIFPELKGNRTLFDIYNDFKIYIRDIRSRWPEHVNNMNEMKKQNRYRFIK
jgi:hypothetical protein